MSCRYGVKEMAIRQYFLKEHIDILDKSSAIAEEIISDFYAFSSTHWMRHPYEIKTLKESSCMDFPERAYAHLLRYDRPVSEKMSGGDSRELYRIFLHDHNILDVTCAGRRSRLLPFMVYIFTHELVHIARFSRHHCSLLSEEKEQEEKIVHTITRNMLAGIGIKGLEKVLLKFTDHCSS